MRGFKVTINEKVVCVAALPEPHQLQSWIAMGGSFNQPKIEVRGYIEKQPAVSDHLSWGNQYLKVGDRVTIELVDTDNPDEPIETTTIDSSASLDEMNQRIEELAARMRVEFEMQSKDAIGAEPKTPSKEMYCSFCGKSKNDVKRLIAGPGPVVFICNECVGICNDILNDTHMPVEEQRWPDRDA